MLSCRTLPGGGGKEGFGTLGRLQVECREEPKAKRRRGVRRRRRKRSAKLRRSGSHSQWPWSCEAKKKERGKKERNSPDALR